MKKVYKMLAYFSISCLAFGLNAQESSMPEKLQRNKLLDASIQKVGVDNNVEKINSKTNSSHTDKAAISLIDEDFSGGIPATWDVLQEAATGDAPGWFYSTAYTGVDQARSVSYLFADFSPIVVDDWLITDQVTVSEGGFNLVVDMYGRSWSGPDETLKVLVSTTGKTPADFTDELTAVTFGAAFEGPSIYVGGTPLTFNMDAYIGENIYIAFRHEGEDGDILITDVSLSKKRDNDLALGAYYTGEYTHFPLNQNYTPEQIARIDNVGNFAQTNVVLTSSVDGTAIASAGGKPLDPGNDTILDVTQFSPIALGSVEMSLSVDQNQSDDDASDNVANRTLTTTEDVAARDLGIDNILYTFGRETDYFYLVNTFTFNIDAVATSIQFVPGTNTDGSISSVGKSVVVELYDAADALVASSSPYIVTAADIDTLVDIPFIANFSMEAGVEYKAAVYYSGGGYVIGTDGLSFADQSLSFEAGDADYVERGFTGIIRLTAEDVCDYTTIVANENVTDASCNAFTDGSIELSPAGGKAPYSYSWVHDDTLTSNIASDLAAGDYDVTITDDNGCELVTTITVGEPAAMNWTVNPSPTSGCGLSDGEIALDYSASPGETDYTIDWDGAATGTDNTTDPTYDYTIGALGVGLYYVKVSSASECSQDTVQINESGASQISVDASAGETCLDASNGFITITSLDDITGYTFNWTQDGGPLAETGTNLTDVPGGTYTVEGTGGGCTTNKLVVNLSDGPTLDLDLVVSSEISCAGQTDAELTVTFANLAEDVTNYTFTWNDGTADLAETGNVISGLDAGTYNVVANGLCTSTNPSIEVNNPAGLLELNLSSGVIDCNGNETTVEVSSPSDISGYTFDWSYNGTALAGETGVSVTGAAGNYDVVGNGTCDTETGSITVSQPDIILVSGVGVEYIDTDNANINITVSGGTGVLTTSWAGPGGFTSGDEDIAVTENGTYTVTVGDDNGCEVTSSFEVDVLSVSNLSAHNISVYPNPASTTINFDVEGADAENVYVFDATGKSIASMNVKNNIVEMNVESLSNGLYFYHITRQDGSLLVSSKFTVTK